MPRKLDQEQVRAELKRYGFTLDPTSVYTNSKAKMRMYDEFSMRNELLTLNQVRYRQRQGRAEYIEPEILSMPVPEESPTVPVTRSGRSGYERFLAKQSEAFKQQDESYKRIAYSVYQDSCRKLNRRRSETVYIQEGVDRKAQVHGLFCALREAVLDQDRPYIRLTINDTDGNKRYAHVNDFNSTVLEDMFDDRNREFIGDSNDAALMDPVQIDSVFIDFDTDAPALPRARRRRAGFYPFLNRGSLDLSRYGIYRSVEEIPNEPCFVTAMRSSGLFTLDELNMVEAFAKVRAVALTDLEEVADLLQANIYVRIFHDPNELTKGTSFKEVGQGRPKRFTLNVVHDHFFLQEETGYSSFYLKNQERVDGDSRMKDHQRKSLVSKLTASSYGFAKHGVSSQELVKTLASSFTRITDEDLSRLVARALPKSRPFNASRQLTVKQPKASNMVKLHGKRFFGYEPDNDHERQIRLSELQGFVDELPLRQHVEVRSYFSFSELMQRLMFEFGCFDGVYELSGTVRDTIRAECRFPEVGPAVGNPKDYHERLYYVDLNAAYMFAVDGIPTGLPDDSGCFTSEENTRVKDLITLMYEKRLAAKDGGNEHLARTLKFLMNSCWGYSIKRAHDVIHTKSTDVKGTLREYGDLVLCTDDEGRVSRIKTFSPHFNYPQFARSVLNKFNARLAEIAGLVDVLYWNVDAIVVRENDFKKLVEHGLMDDTRMGYFKIEHVFSELHIISKRRWYGVLEDGTPIRHLV